MIAYGVQTRSPESADAAWCLVVGLGSLGGFDLELDLDNSEAGDNISKMTGTPWTWATHATDQSLVFRLEGSAIGALRFIEIKGLLHAVNQPSDGSAPKLWRCAHFSAGREQRAGVHLSAELRRRAGDGPDAAAGRHLPRARPRS